MFLLLVSFSISFGAYFLREKFKQLDLAATHLQQSSYADAFLEAVNLDIHQWTWVPTFLKVYFIGIVETIYITLCQRGLFKLSSTRLMNESHVDTLALESKNDGSIAVITGGDSGIGLEICKGLLDAGFHVIIGIYFSKIVCYTHTAIHILYRNTFCKVMRGRYKCFTKGDKLR